MSFMEALRHKPAAFWLLDGSSPFTDYSGYSRSATRSGTQKKSISLTGDAAFSEYLDANRTIAFSSPVYNSGTEHQPFSMAATISPAGKVGGSYSNSLVIPNPSYGVYQNDWFASGPGATITPVQKDVFGETKTVLKSTAPGDSQNYPAYFNVDNTKTFRLRVKLMDTVIIPGNQIYLGLHGINSAQGSTTWTPITPATGATNPDTGNYYFWAAANPAPNQWLIFDLMIYGKNVSQADMVGHFVAPSGTATYQWNVRFTSDIVAMRPRVLNWSNTGTPRDIYIADFELQEMEKVGSNQWEPVVKYSGPQKILSNAATYDGLSVDGTKISFSTVYKQTGAAKCTYDLEYLQRADIVGVHQKNKNSLYVNGNLVAEVDISEAQQNDTYISPNSTLYSGETGSSQAVMVNNVALFKYALGPEAVKAIYEHNNNRFVGSVPRSMGGEDLFVSKDRRIPYLDVVIDSEELWNVGTKTSVNPVGTALVPDTMNGVSLPGTWEQSFDLYDGGTATPINSVNIQYVAKNATVEASVDGGTTWVTATSGTNLSNIPVGFDPTDKSLMVRITFASGATEAYVDDFEINGYLTNTFEPMVGRTITYTKAVNFDEHSPLSLRGDWGVRLYNGSLAFGADSGEEVYEARTIEMWLKKEIGEAVTFSFSPTTTYVNGVAGGSSDTGEWALYHFVLPANVATFTVSGDVTVGKVAIYDTALSAGEVSKAYTNYTGREKFTEANAGVMEVQEPNPSADVYAHDWSISSA